MYSGVLTGETNRPARKVAGVSGLMARKGGLIRVPATGPMILVLNTQKRVEETKISAVVREIETAMGLEMGCQSGAAADPLAEAAKRVKDPTVAAALVVCDSASLPMLLVAPEARWALVNVAALAADDPDGSLLQGRLEKELWRGFAYLMGAAHSNYEACLMHSVCQPSDLDQMKAERVCPEPFIKIRQHAMKIGASACQFVSYRQACQEGWAPAPTNALQKAVWQKVKAGEKHK